MMMNRTLAGLFGFVFLATSAWAQTSGSMGGFRMIGPGSSTDDGVACWNGTGGDTIQDCGTGGATSTISGRLTIDTDPGGYTGLLKLVTGSNGGGFTLQSDDAGFTNPFSVNMRGVTSGDIIAADTNAFFGNAVAASGGVFFVGLSDATNNPGVNILGGLPATTSTTTAAVTIDGFEDDGAGTSSALDGNELVLSVRNNGTDVFNVNAVGGVQMDGDLTVSGNDIFSGGSELNIRSGSSGPIRMVPNTAGFSWQFTSNGEIAPSADNTRDIGTASLQVKDIRIAGNMIVDGGTGFNGTLSVRDSGGLANCDIVVNGGVVMATGTTC